jgi:hypothetical protein
VKNAPPPRACRTRVRSGEPPRRDVLNVTSPSSVEDVRPQSGHEEVGVPVVVVVGGGDAVLVALAGDPGSLRHVLEREVAAVPEEPVVELRVRFVEARHRGAVHDVDVESAVAVGVEEGDARDHRLGLVPVGRAAGLHHEADARRLELLEDDRVVARGGGESATHEGEGHGEPAADSRPGPALPAGPTPVNPQAPLFGVYVSLGRFGR